MHFGGNVIFGPFFNNGLKSPHTVASEGNFNSRTFPVYHHIFHCSNLQGLMHPSNRRISEASTHQGVDFPRITEICQRVADRPDEVPACLDGSKEKTASTNKCL